MENSFNRANVHYYFDNKANVYHYFDRVNVHIKLTEGGVEGDDECVTGGTCRGADRDGVRGDHRKKVQGRFNGGGITGGLQGTCQK